jgi:alanine racemase
VSACDPITFGIPDPAPSDYPGRAVVDAGAIAHNLAVLRAAAPHSLQMAVVKAGAYGHGTLPSALAALRAGADWLGVAQLEEALDLRRGLDQAGIPRRQSPVLAWIAPSGADWRAAIEADIDLSVSWTWALLEIAAAARAAGRPARIHVKIDTGMSRAGATLRDLPALAAAVRQSVDQGQVELVGAWSHFSRADDPSPEGRASTAEHLAIFEEGLRVLSEAGLAPQIRHISATSGILWHPEAHYDLVRAGIGMYGLSPDPAVATARELGLRPAMRLEAPLTSVKAVDAGRPVSYGGTWRAPDRRWLGLVPLGYGDGILRAASNHGPVTVLTASGPLPTHVVGRVCMDQFVVDLGPVQSGEAAPPARVGDTAVLFGDPLATPGVPMADDWARVCGTINYEIVTRLGERIPRVWTEAAVAPPRFTVRDAGQTRALGQALAAHLRAGDLVMLRGELGAGKTTFAQGIGAGLRVRGRISSPTFIVARVHPSLVGGPDLIHADAYRITDLDDLETLDLDSTLADSVTVVEWGEGKTEALSEERLEVDIARPTGGEVRRGPDAVIDLEDLDDGLREISLRPVGARWDGELAHLGEEARALGDSVGTAGHAPTE